MVNHTNGIAHRIRTQIADQNRSILWLSENSGVSRSTLNRKLNDEDQFTVKELAKISKALGLEPHELASLYFARQMAGAS